MPRQSALLVLIRYCLLVSPRGYAISCLDVQAIAPLGCTAPLAWHQPSPFGDWLEYSLCLRQILSLFSALLDGEYMR